jgi:hypothetical protein
MDPATTFCPNLACPARGQTGQGNIGIHSRKNHRFICTACHKTFTATKDAALLSPADLCGDSQPCGDADGPRVSTTGDRCGVWLMTSGR